MFVRFIVDECTGSSVAKWLRAQGHEAFSVFDDARGMQDDRLLEKAHAENWILITNDKDFGEFVYREQKPHRGIVLLRLTDERLQFKIDALERLLNSFASQLADQFTVVTEAQVRIGGQP
jgi:predicted nuclease of predicted toxin-antitoxin system